MYDFPVNASGSYALAERVSGGYFGEVHRAKGPGGDASVLKLRPELAAIPSIFETMQAEAGALAALSHKNIVATYSIVRGADGAILVITDKLAGYVSLEEVLADPQRKGRLPDDLAAAIVRDVVAALACAHRRGVVHGAVHPRSVMISGDGHVRLAHFGIGRAYVAAICDGATVPPPGLAGYLAPEIALGDPPSPGIDVYATAALFFTLLTGERPPGTLRTSPAVERIVQRALDTDGSRRFPNAEEFAENLAEAMEDDGWHCATSAELSAQLFAPGARPVEDLDAATEDLLAALSMEPIAPEAGGAIDSELGGDVSHALDSLDDGTMDEGLDSVLSELDDGNDPHTVVDPTIGGLDRDPISQLIQLDKDDMPTGIRDDESIAPRLRRTATNADETPLPIPIASHEVNITETREYQQMLRGRTSASLLQNKVADEAAALAAVAELDETPAPIARAQAKAKQAAAKEAKRARPPVPDPLELMAEPDLQLKSRSPLRSLLWLLVIAGAIGALVWVVMSQTELMKKADKTEKENEAWRIAEEARLRAELDKPGKVVIEAEQEDAAVWISLGRAPATSEPLSAGQLHELRFELDGHIPLDFPVTANLWGPGKDGLRVAKVQAKLEAGTPAKPAPIAPAEPPAAAQQGFAEGRGVLVLESAPPGAQVWMLVGFTPEVTVDLVAGHSYEFRVLKDGFVPGYATISADDWKAEAGTGLKQIVSGRVDLVAEPKKK